MLAGDSNVVPTDIDVYMPERCLDDGLFAPERAAYFRLLKQGWTDARRTLHPDERIYTFWTACVTPTRAMRACLSTTTSSARRSL